MAVLVVSAPTARAADSCANAAFRTGPGAKLPDCRAYEQVSPVDKNGNPVAAVYPVITSQDGGRSIFASTSSLGGDGSVFALNPYRATRATAWSTTAMSAPQGDLPQVSTGSAVQAVSEDLSHGVVISRRKLTSDAIEGAGNIYVNEIGTSNYRLVASASGAGTTSLFNQTVQSVRGLVYSGSPDFSRVVFSTTDKLTSDALDNGNANIYRWDGGPLRFIGQVTGSFPAGTSPVDAHRVTADGRVTYSAATSSSQNDLFQDPVGGPPKLISRSHRQGDNPNTPQGVNAGIFNSPDGTSITFGASKPLVDGAVPAADGIYGSIYRWTSAGDGLVDLLAGKLQTDAQKQPGQQIVAVSDNGTYVYFTSSASLAPGAVLNNSNLYALHVPDGRLSVVTSVTIPEISSLRASADGSHIAFATVSSIGGYDNTGAGCTQPGSPPDPSSRCSEVWTWDATDPDTPPTCVSCPPSGTQPNANASLGYPAAGFNSAQSHPVLDDGRVFFDTAERLASGDGNATSDVYEYTPGGQRRLLSSGGSGGAATLGDVTADGTSVFFVSAAGLVPQDVDGVRDVYAARVGGGLASQQIAPSSSASCEGAECQGPGAAARPRPVPGSSSLIPYTPPLATTFKAGKPTSSALRGFARGRALKLRVRVGGPGTVRVRARAKLGRKTVAVASGTAKATRAGTITVSIRLSRAARRELARKKRLRIGATVAFSKAASNSTLRFTITQARAGSSSKGGDR